MLSFNTNCTNLVPIHIKITSVVTSERTPSDTSYQKYVALVALLFFIYLVNFTMLHYTPKKWMRSFFSSISASLQWCYQASNVTSHLRWPLLSSSTLYPLVLYYFLLQSSAFQSWNTSSVPSSRPSVLAFKLFPLNLHTSINFFNFPNDLLLKDGQDSVIFTYLFKHHPTVEFIAYLLEIIPKKGEQS